jgi:hypothetical protein
MKDEYGNECPYDFKNILYIVGASYASEGEAHYTFHFTPSENDRFDGSVVHSKMIKNNIIKPYYSDYKFRLNNNIFKGFT